MIVLLIALILLDGFLTHRILKEGGRELNPLLTKLAEITPHWLVVSRVFGICLALILWYLEADLLIGMLIVVYGYVVFHNFKQLRK